LSLTVVVILATFYGGVRFGQFFERHRLVFELPIRQNIRASFGRLFGFYKRHGQFEQDLWVALATAPGKKDGFYVDVGSSDGEFFSNTKLLDDLGWKGICIDPFPTNMQSRTCEMFRQPVFRESGKKVSFREAGALGGIQSDLGLHQDAAAAAPAVELVTATLDELLARGHAPNYIDYMSMDVEGAEYDALLGLSLDRYQVGAFTIEHNYEVKKRDAIRKLLEAKGYVRVRAWVADDWYVQGSMASRFTNFLGYCPRNLCGVYP
jgi:FkbM family methyltransferase